MNLHVPERASACKAADTQVASVEVTHFKVPLADVLVDASHGTHEHFDLIVCQIRTRDGLEGTGYTYTGGRGGSAIATLLRETLAPSIMNMDASAIDEIWKQLQTEFHYIGRGGILSFAISAIDIALWDIRCKRANAPLSQYLNATTDRVACYAGFIDLTFSDERQARNIETYLNRGFVSFKTKVGAADMARDVHRVKMMRQQIGHDRLLMIDANWSYDVDHAIRFSRAVQDQDITWFEEPICPDNLDGYAEIAKATEIPLALGENFHIMAEFQAAVKSGSLRYLQPDASNIGGITGWLRVADMAREAGLQICSHGMHELHVSLLAAQPHAGQLEVHAFPIDAYTTRPFRIEAGKALTPNLIGTGVCFDLDLLRPHLVS